MGKYLSLLIGSLYIILAIQSVSAAWTLVPNGSFESGSIGSIPDQWSMVTGNWDEHGGTTFSNDMQQASGTYFEGARSLWLHSRVVDTDGTRQMRDAWTMAVTEDWINVPFATHVRIFMRDIKSTHSLSWGWSNHIFLLINNASVAKTYLGDQEYDMIFTHGEFLSWNHYNYTATGADGQSWYVYEYSMPESVDKTHMKIQIVCNAHDWTFYSPSNFDDLEFAVDKVELLSAPAPYGPNASFTANPATAKTGETVMFNASASTSGYNGTHEKPLTEFRWNFGDGNIATIVTPIAYHAYTQSDEYNVTLTVYAPGAIPETSSNTYKVTIFSVPIGGHSFQMKGFAVEKPLALHGVLVVALAAVFAAVKRRMARKPERS